MVDAPISDRFQVERSYHRSRTDGFGLQIPARDASPRRPHLSLPKTSAAIACATIGTVQGSDDLCLFAVAALKARMNRSLLSALSVRSPPRCTKSALQPPQALASHAGAFDRPSPNGLVRLALLSPGPFGRRAFSAFEPICFIAHNGKGRTALGAVGRDRSLTDLTLATSRDCSRNVRGAASPARGRDKSRRTPLLCASCACRSLLPAHFWASLLG